MKGKIALEEHIESPDFPATGTHNFTDPTYFDDVENRLQEYKLRLEDMDATGIETTILSLTQPGVEGITQTKLAIDTAKKMNDHMANFFVKNNPGRFLGFAAVPLQDPAAAAKELERAVKEPGLVGANINGYTNTGDENTARYLDEQPVWEFWAHLEKLEIPVYLHPRISVTKSTAHLPGLLRITGLRLGFWVGDVDSRAGD